MNDASQSQNSKGSLSAIATIGIILVGTLVLATGIILFVLSKNRENAVDKYPKRKDTGKPTELKTD